MVPVTVLYTPDFANAYTIISLPVLKRLISISLVCRVEPESINSVLQNEEVRVMATPQGLCLDLVALILKYFYYSCFC